MQGLLMEQLLPGQMGADHAPRVSLLKVSTAECLLIQVQPTLDNVVLVLIKTQTGSALNEKIYRIYLADHGVKYVILIKYYDTFNALT